MPRRMYQLTSLGAVQIQSTEVQHEVAASPCACVLIQHRKERASVMHGCHDCLVPQSTSWMAGFHVSRKRMVILYSVTGATMYTYFAIYFHKPPEINDMWHPVALT